MGQIGVIGVVVVALSAGGRTNSRRVSTATGSDGGLTHRRHCGRADTALVQILPLVVAAIAMFATIAAPVADADGSFPTDRAVPLRSTMSAQLHTGSDLHIRWSAKGC